ncbi:MAG: hypothetical protein RL222_1137, partial [Bacteroidota bacterium]
GTVWSEQAVYFSGLHLQTHILQGESVLKTFVNVLYIQQQHSRQQMY